MPLNEQRRSQLDGIVSQMMQNSEPDQNIQAVVDDFKNKYGNEQAQSQGPDLLTRALNYTPAPPPSSGNSTIDTINRVGQEAIYSPLSIAQGAAKGLLGTSISGGRLIRNILHMQQIDPEYAAQLTQAHGIGQNVGKLAENGAELAAGSGIGGVAADAVGLTGKLGTAAHLAGEAAGSAATSKLEGDSDTGAAVNATIPLLGKVAVNTAGKVISNALGISTGTGSKAVERAFLNPESSDLAKAMRGDIKETDVVDNLKRAVTKVRDNANAKYTSDLDNIKTSSLPVNWPKDSSDFVDTVKQRLNDELPKFGISQDPATGKLNWRYSPLSDEGKASLKKLLKTVGGWGSEPDDLTPSGLDALKKKIGSYIEGGDIDPIANRVYDTASGGLNKLIPGYQEMTSDYAESSQLLRDLKREFGVKPNQVPSPGTVSRKLSYLLKQNNNYRELLINRLGPDGERLIDQVAGLHLSHNGPRGLAQYLLLGGEALGAGGMHPHNIPALVGAALASSPRIVGESARVAGKVLPIVSPVAQPLSQAGISNLTNQ